MRLEPRLRAIGNANYGFRISPRAHLLAHPFWPDLGFRVFWQRTWLTICLGHLRLQLSPTGLGCKRLIAWLRHKLLASRLMYELLTAWMRRALLIPGLESRLLTALQRLRNELLPALLLSDGGVSARLQKGLLTALLQMGHTGQALPCCRLLSCLLRQRPWLTDSLALLRLLTALQRHCLLTAVQRHGLLTALRRDRWGTALRLAALIGKLLHGRGPLRLWLGLLTALLRLRDPLGGIHFYLLQTALLTQ